MSEWDFQEEFRELKKMIPPESILSVIRSLYFQTAWELPGELIRAGVDPDLVWGLQLKIAGRTGIQGGKAVKAFALPGKNELERLVKGMMFAAFNMGQASSVRFLDEHECELTFKDNCGHGLRMKKYGLPFVCSQWCEVHFTAELNELDPRARLTFVEGLPQGKDCCRFRIGLK